MPGPAHGSRPAIAHEATHVIAAQRLGAPGSVLFGEGLAVWASGKYAGKSLAQWKRELPEELPSLEDLMGTAFRRLPENVAYPLGGVFVETLVARAGREATLHELYGAAPPEWSAACERAKTSPAEVEKAFAAALGR
jgi:hypothetical protein